MLARRAPLRSTKPLNRSKPMRKASRRAVSRGVKPDAEAKRYWDSLADICDGCGKYGDTIVHHILADAPCKGGRRDHMLVVKLCPNCHNMDSLSVHLLGSEAAFQRVHGVDLVAIAVERRDDWLLEELL